MLVTREGVFSVETMKDETIAGIEVEIVIVSKEFLLGKVAESIRIANNLPELCLRDRLDEGVVLHIVIVRDKSPGKEDSEGKRRGKRCLVLG